MDVAPRETNSSLKLLKGRINVASQPGQGSTIIIAMPYEEKYL